MLHEKGKVGCSCFQMCGDWDKELRVQGGVQKRLVLKSEWGCMGAILDVFVPDLM